MSDGIYRAKPIDWTCPNCGHESPSRTFPIIEKLEKQNEILREAVEFYANRDNYTITDASLGEPIFATTIKDDHERYLSIGLKDAGHPTREFFKAIREEDKPFTFNNNRSWHAGKRAREALEKLKDLE